MRQEVLIACLSMGLGLWPAFPPIAAARGIEGQTEGSPVLQQPAGTPTATLMNVNRIAAWYRANGEQERRPSDGGSGLTYPRGTTTAVFASGLMWGGKFWDGRTPVLRVNGYSHSTGTKPGAILGVDPGNWTENPGAPDVRIWRIRRGHDTADLRQDAAEMNYKAINDVTDAEINACRDQYRKDWGEWPWQKGAPFADVGYLGPDGTERVGAGNRILDRGEDSDMDGVLDSGEDTNGNQVLDGETPGIADADQVLWTVYNDIGVAPPWDAPESGLEIQFTAWAYARADALGEAIFKKWRVIYKGTPVTPTDARIEDMYLSQWSDPDLGEGGDDFAGCDTLLSMNYVYNGDSSDQGYANFGLVPPASGYDFLQGPLVPGNIGEDRNRNGVEDAVDFGIWDLQRKGPGFINLPMTSAVYYSAGGPYQDPPFNADGAVQWYQMLRGLPPTPQGPPDPAPLVNPVTLQPTLYWLSGDPVTGQGWNDGDLDFPGDRRILLSSGPFAMALGDTQEIVTAWVGGMGLDHKNSIQVLKTNDLMIQDFFNNVLIVDEVARQSGEPPVTPLLGQNYPNPFNPSTTIRYALPSRLHVTLSVFNTLGQKVRTLVDETVDAGYQSVEFYALGLASGVYLYRLRAGDFVSVKKLVVLK